MNNVSLNLYKTLYLIRRAEENIIDLYDQDEMKTPMHMSMGQEALSVGVCEALGPDDQTFASYRTHATFLARTGDVERFFSEMYGKNTGTAQGKAGSMHLAAPERGHMLSSAIVGGSIPVAVGAAFANKFHNNGRIVCAFFGDGAIDEGVFWESLNAACVMNLPIVFVCEDNGLAVHTSQDTRHGYDNISSVLDKFNCDVYQSDSTDVESIHALASEAVGLTRKTNRPSFLHLKCYRYLQHVGVHQDFDAGYRNKDEYERWFERDCVSLQRERLVNNGMADEDVREIERRIDDRVNSSVVHAQNAPLADLQEIYTGVFYEAN